MTAIILMQPSAGGGGGSSMLIMYGLLFLVVYLFFLRPQAKKQKDLKKYVEELKKGDRVVTNSGIHGRIYETGDTFFIIEVESGRIKFDKAVISLDASKALNKPAAVAKA